MRSLRIHVLRILFAPGCFPRMRPSKDDFLIG
jgi:hypothetical protein